MKRYFSVIFIVILVSSLLLVACAEPAPAPAPTPAPTPSPAPAPAPAPAPGKVTKLVFSNWEQPPDIAKYSGTHEAWAKDFEELTGGRYTVEVVHGGALASIPEAYDAVASGIADIAHFIPQDTDRPFPMSDVVALPFLQVRSDTATKALHQAWGKGYFDKEYSDVKVLYMNASASTDDMLSIDPINSIDDLKGLKIGTGGGSRVELIKALGAVPVFAPPPEIYPMLQKGIIDGMLMSGYGIYKAHHGEYVRYLINPVRMFRVIHVVAMNLDTYNKMPDDVKQIVDTMDADAKYSLMSAKILSDEYEETIEKFLSTTGTAIDWSEEDVAELERICSDIFDKWIADKEAEGLPARDVVNAYYNNLKALGMEKPALGYTPGQ